MTILGIGHSDPLWVPGLEDYGPRARPIDDAGTMPIFDPWQAEWVADRSRLKMAFKCRQSGYSFGEMWDEVKECIEVPGTSWTDLSRGQRQSDELIAKAVKHIEAFDAAIESFDGQPYLEEEKYCESIAERVTIRTIRFRNGSWIQGLPANPDTARGFASNLFLDENAFHKAPRQIKAAVIPLISRGYKIRIVSTGNGKSGPFYEEFTSKESRYSKHRVDIYECDARGHVYRPDIEELRAAMGDDELFAQEYECVFLDEATAFVTYELINQAESDRCEIDAPLLQISADSFAGMDIARRRDLTVIWIVDKDGDNRRLTKRMIVLKNTPFNEQEKIGDDVAQRVGRFAIDETGLGMMLAENLARKHGSKIIPVTFTVAEKEDLAVRMKRSLEDRTFLLPADTRVRAAFHSIKRLPSSGGHFRYDADRSELTGHADFFWAAALAERASTMPAIQISYRPLMQRALASVFRGRRGAKEERFPPRERDIGRQRDRTRGF